MPRKIILSFVLGFFLTDGFVVLGQQQNAPSQNQSKPTALFRNFFGIGEPTAAQNPNGQQQSNGHQHVHNHSPANSGNNANAPQTQQVQVQPQQQPPPTQRPATAQTNTSRIQNNNTTTTNPGTTGTSRIPVSRETAFSPNHNESPKIASATPRETTPRESEEATLKQLGRFRDTIIEGTAGAREQANERKSAALIIRNNRFDSLETDGIADSSTVGKSSTGTNRKSIAIDMEEEDEDVGEKPISKRESPAKPALPSSSERQKRAVVEVQTPPQKSNQNTKKVVPADDEEYNDESLIVSTTPDEDEEDFEENEREVVKESTKIPVENIPRKIGGSSVRQETAVKTPAIPQIKSNATSGVAMLDVEMTGPQKKPIVGQELPYQFTLTNLGGAAAEHVMLLVELPVWAEIQSFDLKVGATSIESKDDDTNLVNWSIDRLDPGESQQLVIHLIPRQRKVFTMNWNHKFKPPVSQMVVDVLEPRIEMSLEGPLEMQWGTEAEFRLRIQNTGNGDAEDVYLTLLQLASENELGEPESKPLGTLKAGEEKILTIDAFALQQEKFDIFVQASSPFGLQAEARRMVKILRPKLTAFVEAPEMQFVDNPSEYRILVQNTGTTPAQNVEIKATIPSSVKYVSHQGNGRVVPSLQNQVIWTVDSIPVGEEFVCSFIGEMKRTGTSQVNISATEKTGLNATAVATTYVEAIADLVLKLENPQRPIEVGKAAYHTITVTNRGSKPAENVEVIAAFAEGVTPIDVEGGKAKINKDPLGKTGGQVFFDKIPVINPKQSVVLKIKAQSNVPGNKRVRAEMVCTGIDIHSIQEESTRYYSNVRGENPSFQRGAGLEEKQRISLNSPTSTPVKEESNMPFFEPLPEILDDFVLEPL